MDERSSTVVHVQHFAQCLPRLKDGRHPRELTVLRFTVIIVGDAKLDTVRIAHTACLGASSCTDRGPVRCSFEICWQIEKPYLTVY